MDEKLIRDQVLDESLKRPYDNYIFYIDLKIDISPLITLTTR